MYSCSPLPRKEGRFERQTKGLSNEPHRHVATVYIVLKAHSCSLSDNRQSRNRVRLRSPVSVEQVHLPPPRGTTATATSANITIFSLSSSFLSPVRHTHMPVPNSQHWLDLRHVFQRFSDPRHGQPTQRQLRRQQSGRSLVRSHFTLPPCQSKIILTAIAGALPVQCESVAIGAHTPFPRPWAQE